MAKFRFSTFLAMIALVAVFGFSRLSGPGTASANIVAGEFSMEVTAPAAAPLGSSFHVLLGVFHDGTTPSYSAAQWKLDYDQTIVTTLGGADITPVAGAPVGCTAKSDNGDTTLVGCIDLSGPNMTYSGNAWDIIYTCNAPGVTFLNLVETTGLTAKTFVKVGTTGQAIHTHNAQTACISTADVSVVKTGPATVNAGGTLNYTIKATNNGPQPWTGGVVVDDMPDTTTYVSCTVDVDVNGDTVVDIAAFPCIPGNLPTLANPFFPSIGTATIVNAAVAIIDGPGLLAASNIGAIAVGGSVTMNLVATAPATCGDTLVNLASGVSDGTYGGVSITDPSFLDGVAITDNNFSVVSTTVTGCPVTIVKTGPTTGAQGGTSSYTLTVTNAGPSSASNVVVTDVLNANTTLNGVATSTQGTCDTTISCNIGTMTSGQVVTITIPINFATPGAVCNTANGTWTAVSGTTASNQLCYTIIPPFNGLVKSVDGQVPASGQSSINVNLWLCVDQATDGIDNNGDSVVDNEAHTCTGNGEGSLDVQELIFTSAACDSRNDDDDLDGKPVDGSVADGTTTPYVGSNPRPECYQPTLEDYNLGLVDKNGGELPEGIGTFEFQIKYDHKLFDINVTQTPDPPSPLSPPANWLPADRIANCTMTIVTENDIRYGCVSTGTVAYDPLRNETTGATGVANCADLIDNEGDGKIDRADPQCWSGLGFSQLSGAIAADVLITPKADMFLRIRPTKDNGVSAAILDENCEFADILGGYIPNTPGPLWGQNTGDTKDCTDLSVTIRRLEGDMNQDCNVNLEDQQLTAFRYGSFFGNLNYQQFYDVQPWPAGDFDIDIKDLQFVFGRDGSTCAAPIPDSQNPLPALGINQP